MKRRLLVIVPLLLLMLLLVGYVAASEMLYRQLATVPPHCNGKFADNTPDHFSADPFNPDLDVTPFLMPQYETIEIPSRDPGIMLSAWFVPVAADAPAVVVTHGLGVGTADCKHNPHALLAAGMLYRAGYNVLLIDLRQHGDSTITDGMWAANTREYRDVLGAWDWLVHRKGFAPQHIGLLGYSGGTGATIIAMSQEPGVAAAWLDSPYADLTTTISDRLIKDGYPTWLIPGGYLMAALRGDNLLAYSPLTAAAQIAHSQRPVYIVHATGDPVLPVRYGETLASAIRDAGGAVQLWLPSADQHVGAMFAHTDDYAQRLAGFFDAHLR